jgi:hypothetical protein
MKYRILVGKPEGKSPPMGGRIILRWISGWDGMDWIWLRIGTSGGFL